MSHCLDSRNVAFHKKGNKQILVECLNVLYRTMVAALLYYQKFTNTLKERGYTVNDYDPCVWNKTVNGNQCTICFLVNDCKISHTSKKVVSDTIEWLQSNYKSIFEDGTGCLEPEREIRCRRKGMCKISQLENYELSLG
jgi:hypothetical protein